MNLPTSEIQTVIGSGRGIINRMRQQIVCFWPIVGEDQFSQPLYGPIVEIRARWDDNSVQFDSPGGQQLTSRAIVYPGIPVEVGSIFIKQKLMDVLDREVPSNNPNVFEVKASAETPNIRNTQVLYTNYLD